MTVAPCYWHSDVPATSSCRGCFRALCDVCTINDQHFTPRCASCFRRRRTLRLIFGMLGTLVVTIAAVWGGFRLQRTLVDECPYDYGAQTAEVQRLTEQLRKEPCDRHKILDLGELMLGAGDGRGTLKELNAFLAKCGDYPQLRRVTLAAHM